jgi:hypothetical protein
MPGQDADPERDRTERSENKSVQKDDSHDASIVKTALTTAASSAVGIGTLAATTNGPATWVGIIVVGVIMVVALATALIYLNRPR